jgi:hypothetical protein
MTIMTIMILVGHYLLSSSAYFIHPKLRQISPTEPMSNDRTMLLVEETESFSLFTITSYSLAPPLARFLISLGIGLFCLAVRPEGCSSSPGRGGEAYVCP